MARNEEKQQGRLNRLWLQKEREEGRIRDVQERRPKLATLTSVSSVKKWIPSIKNEIEYYLQQSQLSHYPERKIAEFQQHIEALEREYKSFTAKLRMLDPSCKHKPWTPRAYCKRRAETQECPSIVKNPRQSDSNENCGQCRGGKSDLDSHWTRQKCLSYSETRFQTHFLTNTISEISETVCKDQDQPLSFDRTRLAVAAAAFRGSSIQPCSSPTQNLARALQSGLPNLNNSPSGQTFSLQCRGTQNNDRTTVDSTHEHKSESGAAQRIPGKSTSICKTEERSGHVLGLDCYSSSDED